MPTQPPSTDPKPPGKPGPPKGSMNALRRGGTVNPKRLVVGELPSRMVAVKREAREYRRTLEAEVVEVKGQIDTTDAHLIDTAAAATVQAGICRWLLRNKVASMSVSDIRNCSSDIVRAKERRDAAVRALKLDAPEPDPWSVIATQPAAAIEGASDE